MSKFNARRICYIALLAAMYYVLNLLEIRTPGNLHVTLDALPVMVSALLIGPLDAALVAFFGETLNQILGYGVTATTLLWAVPPVLFALIIALAARGQKEKRLEERAILCYVVCIAAALIRTTGNTAVIWLDSVIYKYYSFAYVFGSAAIRFVTGVIAAVLVATVTMPLLKLLRRQNFLK